MARDINFFQSKDSLLFGRVKSKQDISSNEYLDGYFIDADEKEARKIVESLKNLKEKKLISIRARDEDFNRRAIETLRFDYLVSPEFNSGKDSLKQRSSGLNHVLLKEATKKGIGILISLDLLIGMEKLEKSILIARIIQNIKLCRKSKCAVKLTSFSKTFSFSERERKIIGQSWGMSSQQVRDSCVF